MTHTQILELIENVDVNDSDALDEIDARVWCFIKQKTYRKHRKSDYEWGDAYGKPIEGTVWIEEHVDDDPYRELNVGYARYKNYTRSRDALKAIRPEGWYPILYAISNGQGFIMGFQASLFNNYDKVDAPNSMSKSLFPTEELAELHAIIQAIAHERSEG